MSETVTIDTREQTEEHTFKLITSNNPEGMVFTVNPMGAGTYLKFMDKVKYPLAYQAVMRQIMRFVFGKTYF